jgi:RND family efflux transporter MFP subunit
MIHQEDTNIEAGNTQAAALKLPQEPIASARDEFDEAQHTQRRQRKKRRNLILASLAALLLLTVIAYLTLWRTKKTSDAVTDESTVVSVRVAKVERQTITSDVSALGTIFPREQATVSPKISAQIKQMQLLQNRVVRVGEVIAVLESRDLQSQRNEAVAALQEARLNARGLAVGTIPQGNAQAEKDLRDARASVANARALYERRRTLYAQGGIALKDVEAAQLALTSAEDSLRLIERTATLRTTAINPNDRALAQSRIDQAQQRIATLDAQLSYATIRAPITGVVTNQYQYQGEYAAAGAKLLDIADISEVIVKAPFADEIAAQLKAGDAATIVPTDAPDLEMHGQVALVGRASDPANRTSEVWVRLGNETGRLKTGGAAQVRIAAQEHRNAIVVPASAVTLDASNGKEGTVIVVDASNIAHETKVLTGLRAGARMEIVSGLNTDETIVVEGNFALPDGTRIEPQDAKETGDGANKSSESDTGPAEKSNAANEKTGAGAPEPKQ